LPHFRFPFDKLFNVRNPFKAEQDFVLSRVYHLSALRYSKFNKSNTVKNLLMDMITPSYMLGAHYEMQLTVLPAAQDGWCMADKLPDGVLN
jgi:hypothetical protein